MTIQEELFNLQDKNYADFQSRLTPGISRQTFIGVRIPQCRQLAKRLAKNSSPEIQKETENFLHSLPHQYYDENILHGLLISEIRDFKTALNLMESFLPFVDNWAVCDTTSPKVFGSHKPELLEKIRLWIKSEKTYTVRFGLRMLMGWFLDSDFKPEYLEMSATVKSSEYYVNMMIAWFFATALAKQPESAIIYIEQNRLSPWVHNKTIQKALESFRIPDEMKTYLSSLKIPQL